MLTVWSGALLVSVIWPPLVLVVSDIVIPVPAFIVVPVPVAVPALL